MSKNSYDNLKDSVAKAAPSVCYNCERSLTKTMREPYGYRAYSMRRFDHLIARSHGGPTTDDNLGIICTDCNLLKAFQNGESVYPLYCGDEFAILYIGAMILNQKGLLGDAQMAVLAEILPYIPWVGWVRKPWEDGI